MTEINKDKDTKQAQGNKYEQNSPTGIGHLSGGEVKDKTIIAGECNITNIIVTNNYYPKDTKKDTKDTKVGTTVSALRVSLVLNLALICFVFRQISYTSFLYSLYSSILELGRIHIEIVAVNISENERQDISQGQE